MNQNRRIRERIVTLTVQRCHECEWSHSPAILAFDERSRLTVFYCLECYGTCSERGDFDAVVKVAI